MDLFGNPLQSPERSANVRPPEQKWTTKLVFRSPHVLFDQGVLRFGSGQSGGGSRHWFIHPRFESPATEASSGIRVPDDVIDRLFGDETIVRRHHRDNLLSAMRAFAVAYPLVVVTVERLCLNEACDFGADNISTAHGLRLLASASARRQHRAIRKDSFVDVDDNGEWYGVPGESLFDKSPSVAVTHHASPPSPPPSSSSLAAAAVITSTGTIDVEMDDNDADDNSFVVSDSPRREPEAIASLITVYLNDSMAPLLLGPIVSNTEFAVDMSLRRNVFSALHELKKVSKHTMFRNAPPDVGHEALVPEFSDVHGFRLLLFPFQRRTVHWMLRSETENNGTIQIDTEKWDMCCWNHAHLQFIHDQQRPADSLLSMGHQVPPCRRDNHMSFGVRGGICCGKTGTGKTTSMIALIYAQKRLEETLERRQRKLSDGTLPLHRLQSVRSARYRFHYPVFYAQCTLIVAPPQVVKQWADEFVKTLGDGRGRGAAATSAQGLRGDVVSADGRTMLRIAVVRDVTDARALSMDTVLRELDVVVMNKAVFNSPNYRTVAVPESIVREFAADLRDNGRRQMNYVSDDRAFLSAIARRNARAVQNDATTYALGDFFTGFVAHAIHWRRLVVDEMHELDRRWRLIERAVSMLSADHTWGLTATPDFNSDYAFAGLKSGVGGYPALLNIDAPGRRLLSESRRTRWNFVNRCTTTSGTDAMPDLNLHRVNVRMTPIEMALYSSIPQRYGRRRLLFCSHHDLADGQWQMLLQSGGGRSDTDNAQSSQSRSHGRVDADRELRSDKALSVHDVAEAMQADRRRRIETLRDQLAPFVERHETYDASIRSAIAGAHPILVDVMNVYANDIAVVMRALSTRTLPVMNVTQQQIIELATSGDFADDAAPASSVDNNSSSSTGRFDQYLDQTVDDVDGNEDADGNVVDDADADDDVLVNSERVEHGASDGDARVDGDDDDGDDDQAIDIDSDYAPDGEPHVLVNIDAPEAREVIALPDELPDGVDKESWVAAERVLRRRQAVQRALARRVRSTVQFSMPTHERTMLSVTIGGLQNQIEEVENDMQVLNRQLRTAMGEFNFFEAVFKRLSNPNAVLECPVCLDDDSTANEVALTACGHEFCGDCARDHFRNDNRCPQCRQRMYSGDLRYVDRRLCAPEPVAINPTDDSDDGKQAKGEGGGNGDDAAAAKNVPPELAGRNLTKFGSKLKRLVELIFELRARGDFQKVIVFAQFDRLLYLIGDALRDFNIDFACARGSIRECEKAIRRFKHDDSLRIMLLSSESTISGVHLVEANHIISVHPPYGLTEDVAYAKMWQAIGRIRRLTQTRTCHVWSLVTTGTMEENMYTAQTQYARGKHEREGNVHWVD